MKKIIFLCAIACTTLSLLAPAADEFIIEKKPARQEIEKNNDEKKYSELHTNLLQEYERLMRCHAQMLRELADAQEQCIDALKKAVENVPKMSRERVKKEYERVQKLCESLENVNFF